MANTSEVLVRPAIFPMDQPIVSKLFLEYADWLPVDLDFQNFAHELAELPGKYAEESGGAVFLAYSTDTTSIPIPSTIESEVTPIPPTDQPLPPGPIHSSLETIHGIVALRPLFEPHTAELKRLYVAPTSRGRGVAMKLMTAVLARARKLGYTEVLLDTLGSMKEARRLYERIGFKERESYYKSVEEAVFYGLLL